MSAFDGLLRQQAGFDVESLAAATKRSFSDAEKNEIARVAHKAYRKTFLTYGMRNHTFVETMRKVSTSDQDRVAARAKELD